MFGRVGHLRLMLVYAGVELVKVSLLFTRVEKSLSVDDESSAV